MKHTPTPWRINEHKKYGINILGTLDKNCEQEIFERCKMDKANAEFIVHAVNMHEKIVEALKHAHNSLRTFRNVPKDDQEWTPIDDEAMKLIEETLSQAERK